MTRPTKKDGTPDKRYKVNRGGRVGLDTHHKFYSSNSRVSKQFALAVGAAFAGLLVAIVFAFIRG